MHISGKQFKQVDALQNNPCPPMASTDIARASAVKVPSILGRTRSGDGLPLPYDVFCAIARELGAKDLVSMEDALYGPGNAPQLWAHLARPLRQAASCESILQKTTLRDLCARGLEPKDQVQFDLKARERMRRALEPAACDTVLYQQLSASRVTLVCRQIERVLGASCTEMRLTPGAGKTDDRQALTSLQQLDALRDLVAARPFATLPASLREVVETQVAEALSALESFGTPSAMSQSERGILRQQVQVTLALLSTIEAITDPT